MRDGLSTPKFWSLVRNGRAGQNNSAHTGVCQHTAERAGACASCAKPRMMWNLGVLNMRTNAKPRSFKVRGR